MIDINITGSRHLKIEHVVLDVNGTIARDGNLLEGVQPLLNRLRKQVTVHMVTTDTYNKQANIDRLLGFEAHIVTDGAEKADYVQKLGPDCVVAIGNGINDVRMCEIAAIGIAVLGPEGASGELIRVADVLVQNVHDALSLLLNPNRLRATLRR